jgi:hypothetical protein
VGLSVSGNSLSNDSIDVVDVSLSKRADRSRNLSNDSSTQDSDNGALSNKVGVHIIGDAQSLNIGLASDGVVVGNLDSALKSLNVSTERDSVNQAYGGGTVNGGDTSGSSSKKLISSRGNGVGIVGSEGVAVGNNVSLNASEDAANDRELADNLGSQEGNGGEGGKNAHVDGLGES